jgi:hypothetical protein
LVITFVPALLTGQRMPHLFYHEYSYGSESTFNPISVLLNGGLDELQIYGHTNAFADVPWDLGGTNVWRNILAPMPQINTYGWGKFLRQEIIPSSLDVEHAQFFPNYELHLIGGGMVYRKMSEWYDAHGYPFPSAWGAATVMTYHFINEIVENGPGQGSNVDAIADLLIFDPLGILLFSSDAVANFFAHTLSLNDWSYQPALSFSPFAARNVGQSFVMKYPISTSGNTSLFYHFGSFGVLGLSFKTNTEDSFSFGVGGSSKEVFVVDSFNGATTRSIIIAPMAGVYWDRNNSLLASMVVSDSFTEIVRVNAFPGVFSLGGFSPGAFLSFQRVRGFSLGFTASFLPAGLGSFRP